MSRTKVITGTVRLSYLNVFVPRAGVDGGAEKYSASLIIPKTDKKTIKEIKDAIEIAKKEGAAKFGGKIPANLKTPLRDGDTDRPDDPAYANSYFINATSTRPPGIVDANLKPLMSEFDLYSGCYGRASIVFYPYNTNGNRGIGCGLHNLQKLEDGEPLGGMASAAADFGGTNEDFEV